MLQLHKKRQQSLASLIPNDINALLLKDFSNLRYLTGFSGSAGTLLLERKKATFLTDFRYQEQSKLEVGDSAEVIVFQNTSTPTEALFKLLRKKRLKVLGVEGSLPIELFEQMSKDLKTGLKVVSGLCEGIRKIKDETEIDNLKRAFSIADKSFAKLLEFIEPGKTELEITAKLEYLMRLNGSEKLSFDTIVASGDRSACPHAHPTEKKIESNRMLKIDFGAVFNGYHSDMTRTVFIGKADRKFKNIYSIVRDAQRKAIDAIRPGISCKQIDQIARDHITKKGYGPQFGHGLGHAVGIDVHEIPSFSQKSKDYLEAGMVLTVEPGIYIPGWGGVRIEDVFVVKSDGVEQLTKTPNDLLEI
ncbi:aminopeptidase P family protein [bacterium]|nr:aminopeptidase P family protein [bacterium]